MKLFLSIIIVAIFLYPALEAVADNIDPDIITFALYSVLKYNASKPPISR
jgi:hypothetical protein